MRTSTKLNLLPLSAMMTTKTTMTMTMLLLAVFLISITNALEEEVADAPHLRRADIVPQKEHDSLISSRKLKASETPPSSYPVWENKPCVPFSSVTKDQLAHGNTDGSCENNECGGGCCRFYHWLLCDDTGDAFQVTNC